MIDIYYILFSSSDTWIDKFFRKGFSKITVLKRLPGKEQFCLMCPHETFNVDLNLNSKDTFYDLKNIMRYKIVKVEVDKGWLPKPTFYLIPFRWSIFMSTGIVKYILGIRSWCFTPFGLFRFLLSYKGHHRNRHLMNIELV